MVKKTELAHKIQIASNRLRCPDCNSSGDSFFFLLADDVRFRFIIGKVKLESPVYMRNTQSRTVMGVNKGQVLSKGQSLIRVCVSCGHTRKTTVTDNFRYRIIKH